MREHATDVERAFEVHDRNAMILDDLDEEPIDQAKLCENLSRNIEGMMQNAFYGK